MACFSPWLLMDKFCLETLAHIEGPFVGKEKVGGISILL